MELNKDTEAAGCLLSFLSQRSLEVVPPHNDTVSEKYKSLQDSTLPFDELEQWLGEVNTALNGRYQMAPLFITLVVITTETPYWALAKLSPVKTEVTVAIHDQMLNVFHSLRFILMVLHAQMTAGKGCPPQFYKNIRCHGTRVRPPHEATATYFVSL